MNNLGKATAVIVTAAAIAGGSALYTSRGSDAHKIPADRISGMLFPKGLHVTGDPSTGEVCHSIILRDHGKPDENLGTHMIAGVDFRNKSEKEKKAAIITEVQAETKEMGIACTGPASDLVASSYANYVKRCDGCGTDCWITGCDATSHPGYCTLGGTNCVITFICCGSTGCPASCDV